MRTTCYDAIALEYNTVVLTDCCSSQTEEIQRVNLEDMGRAGAILMDSAAFRSFGPDTVPDTSAAIRAAMEGEDIIPEPFARVPTAYTGRGGNETKGALAKSIRSLFAIPGPPPG